MLLTENIDFICRELILPFATLKEDELENMDVVDIVQLFMCLLEYNGIQKEKAINFFKPSPNAKRAIGNLLDFGGIPIPSQA